MPKLEYDDDESTHETDGQKEKRHRRKKFRIEVPWTSVLIVAGGGTVGAIAVSIVFPPAIPLAIGTLKMAGTKVVLTKLAKVGIATAMA